MCGIAGFMDLSEGRTESGFQGLIQKMTDTIRHRGPDNEGHWWDTPSGVCFGFRRLAILDLSEQGKQPMHSADGRYTIIFNGEIYNHHDLRKRLEQEGKAPAFRGHSDTEVLLAAMSVWGVEETVRRTNGMFAIAVWDRESRSLYLTRDRLGEKPIYFASTGSALYFASELKALKVASLPFEIDRDALALYFRHNCIPAPYTIYKNIQKLPPATLLKISAIPGLPSQPSHYWSAKNIVETTPKFQGSFKEGVDELESLLLDAVKIRMEADVPLGAFLSGGVDSSALVA
jgi:asparagine synthase (glutamine-hydrolysing)